jgi:ribonuclease VapC
MIFIDASALVAILTAEPEGQSLLLRVEETQTRLTSSLAIFEAVLAICRKRSMDVDTARDKVSRFLSEADVLVVPVDREHAQLALEAHARYGKGHGHPAQLNMGDCFAYAMAKSNNAALLFKGDDFTHTDIRSAVASS